MVDRKLLRSSATLIFIGVLAYLIASQFHAGGGTTYESTFSVYAASGDWAAVHLAEFASIVVLSAGTILLFFALNISEGPLRWVALFGAVSAVITLALASVLSAVDGVALKQAVVAWANAPAAEQAARLASAEAIRWLEWGVNSYQNFMSGLTLLLFAVVIVWTARVPRPIGYLMGLSGVASLVVGWVVGTRGFGPHAVPMEIGGVALLVASIWLFIVAWRMKELGDRQYKQEVHYG